MIRPLMILLTASLFFQPAARAGQPAIELDLYFPDCSPDVETFPVLFPDGSRETAEASEEDGRWRIELRDAVDPKDTRLQPEIPGFDVQPSKGEPRQGVGVYSFRCVRLKTLVVQSDPFEPSLSFRYKISKPAAQDTADTADCRLTIHPEGAIAIFLKQGDCPYKLKDVFVRLLEVEKGQTIALPLFKPWAEACAGGPSGVTGLDMGTAAAQLARERSELSKPDHDRLIVFLSE